MKNGMLLWMLILPTVLAASCHRQPSQSSGEPFLLLDNDEPPLLLDNESASAGPVADNDRCFVCHLNYMNEDIAVVHARANIGCADCHGESDEHIADESWASGGNGTPPGIMYPRDRINPACMKCHPKARIDTEDHAVLFDTPGTQSVCTDCHGEHRLEARKCIWK